MRILSVSTSYPRDPGDWRGAFIRHQVSALAESPGLDIRLWAPPGEVHRLVQAATTPCESEWLGDLMQAGGISHIMRQGGVRGVFAPLRLLWMLRRLYVRCRDVDLYHLNWLQCALPLPRNGKPALVCVLGNDLKLLRLPLMRSLLRRSFRGRRAAICPNAEWMIAPLRQAFGDIAQVEAVPFGIDSRWYAVRRDPRRDANWLVVSRLTHDKIGPLFEWAAPMFRGASRKLHLFGPMQDQVDIPGWVNYHGPATPDALATQWFPTATGLITLSQHAEGRPQVMLEAMAAGLPIIASNIEAHTSLIAHGVTGEICHGPGEFTESVNHLESPSTNRRYGEASRCQMQRQFGTWQDCANRYVAIYRQLLASSNV